MQLLIINITDNTEKNQHLYKDKNMKLFELPAKLKNKLSVTFNLIILRFLIFTNLILFNFFKLPLKIRTI